MQCEDDPNVIYGGDVDDSIDEFKRDYASLGDLILSDLLLGKNRIAFVREIIFLRSKLLCCLFLRSMA